MKTPEIIFVCGRASVSTWVCVMPGMHALYVNGTRRGILTASRGTVGNNVDGWRTRKFWNVVVDGVAIDTLHTLATAKRITINVMQAGGPEEYFARVAANRARVEANRVEREKIARAQKIAMFEREAIDAIKNMKAETTNEGSKS